MFIPSSRYGWMLKSNNLARKKAYTSLIVNPFSFKNVGVDLSKGVLIVPCLLVLPAS